MLTVSEGQYSLTSIANALELSTSRVSRIIRAQQIKGSASIVLQIHLRRHVDPTCAAISNPISSVEKAAFSQCRCVDGKQISSCVCITVLFLIKRIQRFHAKRFEIAYVACHHDKPVHSRGCGDKRIFNECVRATVHESRPFAANGGIHRQHLPGEHQLLQPGFYLAGFAGVLLARHFDAALGTKGAVVDIFCEHQGSESNCFPHQSRTTPHSPGRKRKEVGKPFEGEQVGFGF